MENEQFDVALSILDEGLLAATKEKNTEEVTRCINLKRFTHDFPRIASSHKESDRLILCCFMCGRGEADGAILVAGAGGAICDQCIKKCLRDIATKKQAQSYLRSVPPEHFRGLNHFSCKAGFIQRSLASRN